MITLAEKMGLPVDTVLSYAHGVIALRPKDFYETENVTKAAEYLFEAYQRKNSLASLYRQCKEASDCGLLFIALNNHRDIIGVGIVFAFFETKRFYVEHLATSTKIAKISLILQFRDMLRKHEINIRDWTFGGTKFRHNNIPIALSSKCMYRWQNAEVNHGKS